MSFVITAKPPRRMRIASGAVLIPQAQFAAWHDQVVRTPGLNDVERKVLDAIRTVVDGFA